MAGSTWSADEAVVVDAAGAVRGRGLPLRLLVAPHEPTPDAVRALRSRLRTAGWRSTTLGEVEGGGAVGEADAVVVDRVGVLAHLYTVGALAHVGGGFGRAGLHSVLEPAAAGVPVLFGPHHRSARAAGELVGAGAGFVVRDAGDAARRVETLLADAGRRAAAGAAARRYIDVHRGAARRTAERVALYLQSPTAEFGSRPR
ncbi:MAG: hypothetical protein D6701_00155 [Gemmatimonadetes bacterium]|nr:MAG: hypothetical protein D6701_00155 [Gemmatimonadota bacterium]